LTLGNRSSIDRFNLKKRDYIGITSMDAELSLLMANMAQIEPGHLVLDPFVGTGSLLLVASHFGAFTLGSDIDGRQLRGKECSQKEPSASDTPRDIWSNAKQYKLQGRILDALVFDNTCHPWRLPNLFDAIICDR
jgi:tRNA (guanine10-N2)-methyltransferase